MRAAGVCAVMAVNENQIVADTATLRIISVENGLIPSLSTCSPKIIAPP
jgi:hypothetical protein